MVFSILWWRSILLVDKTGIPGENHRPVASHWQTLSQCCIEKTIDLSQVTDKLYQPPVQSVPITIKVVSSNLAHDEVYLMQHCDKVCQWLAAGRWFSLYNIVISLSDCTGGCKSQLPYNHDHDGPCTTSKNTSVEQINNYMRNKYKKISLHSSKQFSIRLCLSCQVKFSNNRG
jgi:hypothetical protein